MEKYTVDVNLFHKRRKPKYQQRYKKERLVEIFEMTYTGRGYQGYTPVKGFKGDSHTDLKENIDDYLKDLIEFINKPLVECKSCNGYGVELEEIRHG